MILIQLQKELIIQITMLFMLIRLLVSEILDTIHFFCEWDSVLLRGFGKKSTKLMAAISGHDCNRGENFLLLL